MKFDKIIGVGGIGTGIFFKLSGNHTLGREESRLATLTDFKDYCKQHIILSYTARLVNLNIKVYAIGKVGFDVQGEKLISEMQSDCIDCTFVEKTDKAPTMTSVCFQYENGEGGNITASNSACNLVDERYIDRCLEKLNINSKTLALCASEIPISTRIHFAKICKEKNAFVAASYSGEELRNTAVIANLSNIDLLSINTDEAKAIVGDCTDFAEKCYEKLQKINPNLMLTVTLGKNGANCYYKNKFEHIPAIKSNVISTAGAGDAFLGATIAMIAQESDFFTAVKYGAIASHFAVESADTISRKFSKDEVKNYV